MLRILALVTATFAAAASAQATTVRPIELPELAKSAQLVVVGSPTARVAFRVDGRILTRVTVRIEESWVGSPGGPELEVVLLGGVLGEIGQRVEGEARLDQRAVLFLVRDEALSAYRVVAMAQGEWPVVPIGAPIASAPITTVTLGPRGVSDLSGFKRQVQDLARAP